MRIAAPTLSRTFSTRELKVPKRLETNASLAKVCPQRGGEVESGERSIPAEVICGGACGGS